MGITLRILRMDSMMIEVNIRNLSRVELLYTCVAKLVIYLHKQERNDLINGLFERVDAGKIQMDALTFWGFWDIASWRKEYSPLLYGEDLAPKYAYYGALQVKDKAGY